MLFNKIIFPLIVIFISFQFPSWAQPKPYGCHHWRTLNGQGIQGFGGSEREINPSISKSDTFDIIHYDITVDITNVNEQKINAFTTISYKAKQQNQGFIRFDFFHITKDKKLKLTVDSVVNQWGKMDFHQDSNSLHIDFADIPEVDSLYELTVYYQGSPHRDAKWGGFIFDNGYIYNLGIGISSIPPNFGKVWYPCFDSFVERATYTYHVISSGKIKAHCQGDFMGEEVLSGDTIKRSFHFKQPIPTHIASIAAADYVDIDFDHEGYYGKVPVRITSLPSDSAKMRAKFKNVGKAIDACEFWYGPNHWGRVGYVTTTQGAMEIPENIAYPAHVLSQSDVANDALISHELGHYWWGDWVAPYSHNDMWLKEGPAEYSSHLMSEHLSGKEEFIKEVKGNHYTVLSKAHINDNGFWPLSPVPDAVVYGNHTYYKGASVLHNLRGYLGDSLFRKGLRNIQKDFPYTTITPAKFRDSLTSYTGVNLNDFFNDQVFSPGFSTFVADSFKTTKNGDKWDVEVFIRQLLRKAPSFYKNVPLDITFISSDKKRSEHLTVVSGEFTKPTFTVPFQPAMVVLNGHNRLNQARMDEELTITPGQKLNIFSVPYVDFRLTTDTISDTTLIRIEHVWAGADTSLKGAGIYRISPTHYWMVDGFWPEKTALKGRVSYLGIDEDDLDFSLFKKTEANAILVYRESAAEKWEVCKDITLVTGSLTNAAGYININKLKKGHYAFANGNISIGFPNVESIEKMNLFPNPVNDLITIEGCYTGSENGTYRIFSLDGRLIKSGNFRLSENIKTPIGVGEIEAGTYFLQINNKDNIPVSNHKFIKL